MDESSSASVPASDAELINTIRSGDPGAPALLRRRHAAAARSVAGQLLGGGQVLGGQSAADDVAASAFTQVIDAIRRGGGPTDAFRPYLLTAVRRAARDSQSGHQPEIPADEQQIPDPGQPFDPAAAGHEAAPLVAAFLSLPERWRAVLWHTEIERAAPPEVAPLLGLPAAGVTELAGRAADGLRQAYRQLQSADASHQHADLADIGAALRGTVAPVVLGDATAAYLARPAGSPASRGSPASPGSLASPGSAHSPGSLRLPGSSHSLRSPGAGRAALRNVTAAGTEVASLPGKLRRSTPRPHALAAGALLATFGVAAYVLTPGTGTVLVTAAGQSTAPGQRVASGQRAAAIALGTLVLPASAQAPARRPVKPPASGHRATSSRQPPEAAAPVALPAPGLPPAQRPRTHPLAKPPAQRPPAQPTAKPPVQRSPAQPSATAPNPALAAGRHVPGGDWTAGFLPASAAVRATCSRPMRGTVTGMPADSAHSAGTGGCGRFRQSGEHGTESRRAGLPGWREASGQQATPQWPAWHVRPGQLPAWQGTQWHAPSSHGGPWHLPPWPGQGARRQGWPGNG
jgi:DNA-directed RNA polymerase specialized sigma24 family protein